MDIELASLLSFHAVPVASSCYNQPGTGSLAIDHMKKIVEDLCKFHTEIYE